jgi:excisionase family DNA binding protein
VVEAQFMQNYLTPEELAQHLKVELTDVMSLIEQGKLRALRIGKSIRIQETEVEKLHLSCAAVPTVTDARLASDPVTKGLAERFCFTRTGRAKFGVRGSVKEGADIWPGHMRYPIKFPKQFMETMLAHFREREIPVGGKFDDPGRGSLGEFIQQKLKTKMNPAVYLAALLSEEGYVEPTRRGYIRFRSVEEAASWRGLQRTIREIRAHNSDADPDEIQRIVDQAVGEVRAERRAKLRV